MLKILLVIFVDTWFLILKITIVYFLLIIVLRILGKREVGELSIFDLVVLLLIADIASLGIDNDEFVIPSYICVLCLVVFQKLLSYLLLKVSFFRQLIDGEPVVIVIDGKLMIKNMMKERYTIDDLISQMRLYSVMDIDEIKLAILETNGVLSIFRTSRFDEVKLPVIISGKLVKDNLFLLNQDIELFEEKLKNNGIYFKEILYASLHNDVLFYFDRKNSKQQKLEGHRISLK